MTNPLVCIIVVNWNGGKVIEDCIGSLKMTDYDNYKVIIIDNGSEDKERVKKLKQIDKNAELIFLDKNYGYTIGTNTGWKYAIDKYNADYICAMNSDTITIQPDWLQKLVETAESDKYYGYVSGMFMFPNGDLQMVNANSEAGIFEKDNGQYDYVKEVDYLRGPCPLIKRSLIDKIGGLDENFFYGPDDIDYCLRSAQVGYKTVFNGNVKIIHLAGHAGLSHNRDKIFGRQVEGMLICWYRHFGLIGGVKMSVRQFARIFVTRRNPFAPKTTKNLYFNWTFYKRFFSYCGAFLRTIYKIRNIKQDTEVVIL